MKKIKTAGVLLLAALLLITGVNCAKKRPPRFEDKLSRMIDKISDSLSLDEGQKAAAVEIKKEIMEKNDELKKSGEADGREIEETLSKEIIGEKFNAGKLNKLLDQKMEKREELRRYLILELAKFHSILSPEQRVKLASIMKDLGPEHRPGGKKGPAR